MRARQRHLNKSLRDTACAFDSRFLSGFSDGNAVDTWTDLSSNARNASQSTAANRPAYKTAIQGGNPIVRFDGSNDILTTSTFASATQATAIIVASASNWSSPGAYRHSFVHGYGVPDLNTTGSTFAVQTGGTFAYWLTGDIVSFGNGYNTTAPRTAGAAASGSDFRIISSVLWSSLARVYSNGARISTRTEVTSSIGSFTRSAGIGAALNPAEYWNGDIAAVIFYTSNIGDAMRVRLERTQALCFKIACS